MSSSLYIKRIMGSTTIIMIYYYESKNVVWAGLKFKALGHHTCTKHIIRLQLVVAFFI